MLKQGFADAVNGTLIYMFIPGHEIKKNSNTTVYYLQNTSKDMKSTTIQVVTKCEPIVKGLFLM